MAHGVYNFDHKDVVTEITDTKPAENALWIHFISKQMIQIKENVFHWANDTDGPAEGSALPPHQ